MKLFKNILLFAVAATFASCETDVETPQLGNITEFVAPVIGQCSDVIVNADNSKEETVILLDNNVPLERIQLCMGHSDISVTTRYAKIRNEREVVRETMEIEVF